MIVTLTEARNHLRIISTAEDDQITLFIEAAETHIANFLNADVPGLSDSPPAVPAPIKAAALLIVGDLFDNRSAQVEKPLSENRAVVALLMPYRQEMGI